MIPEDRIVKCLNFLLGQAEPGAAMHHLSVISCPQGAVGPLGTVDPEQLKQTFASIAYHPVPEETCEQFVARSVMAVGIEQVRTGMTVVFAAISQEMCTVQSPRVDELARRLMAQGRLSEHPDAVEATLVYGACRDGRRWQSRRWVTGPQAGKVEDAVMLVGPPTAREGSLPVAPLVRRLVGQSR